MFREVKLNILLCLIRFWATVSPVRSICTEFEQVGRLRLFIFSDSFSFFLILDTLFWYIQLPLLWEASGNGTSGNGGNFFHSCIAILVYSLSKEFPWQFCHFILWLRQRQFCSALEREDLWLGRGLHEHNFNFLHWILWYWLAKKFVWIFP